MEMFGCVGGDEAGRSLIKNMEDMGVGTTHIKVAPGVNTGLAVITVGITTTLSWWWQEPMTRWTGNMWTA